MQKNVSLLEFLSQKSNYPEKPSQIIHYETHISHVFVGEEVVYKIKKPVNLGFLDFTTLRKRRFYCFREFELNSRLSKNIYLGVVPIYLTSKGFSFHKTKDSKIYEYAVKMKKIPEEKILYKKIEKGELLFDDLKDVCDLIVEFHKNAPIVKNVNTLKNTIYSTEENFSQIETYIGKTIDKALFEKIANYTRNFVTDKKRVFINRLKDNFVKEIHGDLHSQHVCLSKPPVIFDCIEFNNRFRKDDILNDIAFLLMDLEFKGRFDLSKFVFNHYKKAFPDAIDNELLRFYKVYRAVVRGKVEGFISDSIDDMIVKNKVINRARDYYKLAEYYVDGEKKFNPIICMGPSGSGKSTIAKCFGQDFFLIRSDAVRKDILGMGQKEHAYVDFGEGIYSKEITEKTYEKMVEIAREKMLKGFKVIMDATFLKMEQREKVLYMCEKNGFNPLFIFCIAPKDVLLGRVKKRKEEGIDISDAHEEILLKQLKEIEEPFELSSFRLFKLDTSTFDKEIFKKVVMEMFK